MLENINLMRLINYLFIILLFIFWFVNPIWESPPFTPLVLCQVLMNILSSTSLIANMTEGVPWSVEYDNVKGEKMNGN